jgi:hypothetical protein
MLDAVSGLFAIRNVFGVGSLVLFRWNYTDRFIIRLVAAVGVETGTFGILG